MRCACNAGAPAAVRIAAAAAAARPAAAGPVARPPARRLPAALFRLPGCAPLLRTHRLSVSSVMAACCELRGGCAARSRLGTPLRQAALSISA